MVSVSLKIDASTYVEPFETLPTWDVLTSRISERFNMPSQNVNVGYVDNAQDTVILTNDQTLRVYYESLGQSPQIKFMVLDRHIPDTRSIMTDWPSDFDIHVLSNSVQLFCWVLKTSDPDSTEPFLVDIRKEKTVDDLKAKMKEVQERTFAGLDTGTLRVWKLSPPIPSVDFMALNFTNPAENPGCIKLNPADCIEKHFLSPLREHIHLIIQLPTSSRKRSRSPEDAQASKKARSDGDRKWCVNGAITGVSKDQVFFLEPADQEQNDIMRHVSVGKFSLIIGPRSSGKSTRLFQLCESLEQKGCRCLYFTFERVDYSQGLETFWSSVGAALQYASRRPFSLSSSENFIDAFMESIWDQSIILLIDELSEMLLAPNEIRDSFLRALRTIRHSQRDSAVKSVIAAGTFSSTRLTTSTSSLVSPFNVQNPVQIPYFNKDETRKVFEMFAQDNYIMIDEAVIDDIWTKSNGHPGMTCICGKVISDNLKTMLDHQLKTITYANWQKFPVSMLHEEILAHNTFRSMVKCLKAPAAQDAMSLFRTTFAGFLGEVEVTDLDEDLADFLTSEGVLSRPNLAYRKYRVTSPLIDSLVRLEVIPSQFPSAPAVSPLQFHPKTLHIPRVLEECLKFFDKRLMQEARWRSSKMSTVSVNGYSGVQVPRESVYDTELMRILCNWLRPYGWFVTRQWHLKTPEGHKYSDIVLGKLNDPARIVLELLATGDKKSVEDHIARTPEYMSLVPAHERWVIHFTCEDPFTPIWQPSAQLTEGVNVIHVAHDFDFTEIVMHIYWRDETGNTAKRVAYSSSLKIDICLYLR